MHAIDASHRPATLSAQAPAVDRGPVPPVPLPRVLAVVPGDTRVDLQAIKALLGGTYASFASPDIAERLSGSVVGTVLPFSFHPDLQLIVDPALLAHDEIFFNAARLDRSLALRTADYMRLAAPRTASIAAHAEVAPPG